MPKSKSKTTTSKIVPYVRGFRPSTPKQKVAALGYKSANEVPKSYQEDASSFLSIPPCTSIDDWLAQYKEEGQTYSSFMAECPWLSTRQRKCMSQKFNPHGKSLPEKYYEGKIYILPLGNFDSESMPKLDDLMEYAEIFYDIPVRKLETVELTVSNDQIFWSEKKENQSEEQSKSNKATKISKNYKLKSRFNSKSGKFQLCVDGALMKLKRIVPEDAICVIALTSIDLYADEPDLFVAGMAAGAFKVAIFSLYRYDPNMKFSTEFWHDIKIKKTHNKVERSRLILQRSCRLLVHELAHLLGIDHCIHYSCCMNGAGHLAEDFTQPMFLCPVDLRKLHTLCGFDIVERYKKMYNFFKKHGIMDEQTWLQKRLYFLTGENSI